MTLTLTQVLLQQDQMLVFGQQVSDFYLRGDLGLGLDPEGPVGFAWIQACKTSTGERRALPSPMLLSVHGPGELPERPQSAEERCWRVYRSAEVVRVTTSRLSWAECLDGGLAGGA